MTITAIHGPQLAIPPLPPRHVPRPRLQRALDTALLRPLTLLAAGPGSGKTVLLSDWASARERPPAWVTLTAQHNQPHRFLAAVSAAFAAAGVVNLGPARGSADLRPERLADQAVTSILEHGTYPDLPLVLVLDDAHVLTHPEILDGLDGWLRRWGDQFRLVLAARSDPLLPLHRYRLAGSMSELRAIDLAATRQEAKQVLIAHGVHLADPYLELLTTRTEGWIAGVRLSAMSMEGTERASDFVTGLALDDGSIGEYLIDEVLDRQSPEVRRLMIETSFLDEVNGDLAEAVTGLQGAGSMLVELTRSNSFVLPLDRSGSSFRYHQLLSEILRYLLRREEPERRRDLVRRAADWYLANDDLVSAAHFAREIEDWRFLARMLARGGVVETFVHRLDLGPLRGQRIADALARDDADDGADAERSEILIAAAAAFAYSGRPRQARTQLGLLGDGTDLAADLAVAADIVYLMIARAQHRVREADALSGRLLAESERCGRPDLAAAVRIEQAMTHFYAGAHVSVESTLRRAAADAARAEVPALELECWAQLAHVNAFWARFRTSTGDVYRANMLLRRFPRLAAPASLLLAVAERDVVKGEFATASKAIRRADSLSAERRDDDLRGEIAVVRTIVYINSGRLDDASRSVGSPDATPSGLVADYRLAIRAEIDIRSGRPDDALRALAVSRPNQSASVVCLARATAHLVLGDLDAAEAALRPILTASGLPSVRSVLVASLIADAKILHLRAADGRAAESLVRALELADGEIVLPFMGTNELLDEVVSHHPLLAAQWPVAPQHPTDATAAATSPGRLVAVDPLTDKEATVLRWLASSRSISEIAAELGLSVNTVKTHSAAIYRKLGAPRRREAVIRAQHLELL